MFVLFFFWIFRVYFRILKVLVSFVVNKFFNFV